MYGYTLLFNWVDFHFHFHTKTYSSFKMKSREQKCWMDARDLKRTSQIQNMPRRPLLSALMTDRSPNISLPFALSLRGLAVLEFCHRLTYGTKLFQQREQNVGSGVSASVWHSDFLGGTWVCPNGKKKNTSKSVSTGVSLAHMFSLFVMALNCNTNTYNKHSIKPIPKRHESHVCINGISNISHFLSWFLLCQCSFDNLACILPCSSAGLIAFVIICSCCSLNIAPRLIGLHSGPT